MKKILALLLVITFVFSLSACETFLTSINTSTDSRKEQNDITEPVNTDEPSETNKHEPTHIHSFSKASCTEPEICSCGATNGSALGHNYSQGECSRCGLKDPNYTAVSKSKLNALKRAESYLNLMGFSKLGLIDQLEFDEFSHEDATYAVENCNANWNEQSLKKAKSYLEVMAFSYSGLIEQLKFDKFNSEQAKYGADNCGANWNAQAAKKAEEYLEIFSFSRNELINQLEYEGFTHDQAVHGANSVGL